MYTSCVPNSGTCDGDCMMDSKIRYCGSAYPHCYTQNFVFEDEHFTGVGCTDTYGISEYIYPTHTKGTSGPLPAQSTPTSEPADDSDDSGGTTINGGAIAGGVIGGVLAVAGVGGFIIWLITRKLPGENGGGPSTQEQLSEYKFGQSLATSSMAPSDSRSASDAHMFAGVHEVSATSPLPPGVYEVSGDIYKPSGNQTVTELQ
ncbi:MAG: hypothetical protein M1831_001367 [Alyxoria varia]|nr:MAG: hypothetical protein M1831_001367 [Alyxoria varia]